MQRNTTYCTAAAGCTYSNLFRRTPSTCRSRSSLRRNRGALSVSATASIELASENEPVGDQAETSRCHLSTGFLRRRVVHGDRGGLAVAAKFWRNLWR